ncbi:MAG: orotidine-5'-phosphate decarboxylase [Actinobacteria bacterium ATB1]|nr:orotidine-5'-phosphate decarboxylase [Actinobacteria bacterium ATB1]
MTKIPLPSLAVALDTPTVDEALAIAAEIAPFVDVFKVGLELLWSEGPASVEVVAGLGRPVFADAKLDDIPRTVYAAARNLARHPVGMFTVHTSGGRDMCTAAREGAEEGASGAGLPRPLVIGVTVLTSHDRATLVATGVDRAVAEVVRCRTELALESGLDGIVCAPTDLPVVSGLAGDLVRVVPGIRPAEARVGGDDQSRASTPEVALDSGADVLVVGRPVLQAPDPGAAAEAIASRVISRREDAG